MNNDGLISEKQAQESKRPKSRGDHDTQQPGTARHNARTQINLYKRKRNHKRTLVAVVVSVAAVVVVVVLAVVEVGAREWSVLA